MFEKKLIRTYTINKDKIKVYSHSFRYSIYRNGTFDKSINSALELDDYLLSLGLDRIFLKKLL